MSDNANAPLNVNMPSDGDDLSTGSIASVGFSNAGSPGDLMGSTPLPEVGDVGAMDAAGDVDLEGADQRGTAMDSRVSSDLAGSDAVISDATSTGGRTSGGDAVIGSDTLGDTSI